MVLMALVVYVALLPVLNEVLAAGIAESSNPVDIALMTFIPTVFIIAILLVLVYSAIPQRQYVQGPYG